MGFKPTYKELRRLVVPLPIPVPPGFKPTYKELRRDDGKRTKLFHTRVLSLPIRNCDSFLGTRFYQSINVLSLPIRNCDVVDTLPIHTLIFCFKPTYKELRHNYCVNFTFFHSGFKPTYKELRLCILGNFKDDTKRF